MLQHCCAASLQPQHSCRQAHHISYIMLLHRMVMYMLVTTVNYVTQ